MCTASIWHMSTMSMDRYFTLKYPMKYGRNKTKTMVVMKITFVWVVSICICSPVCILGFINYKNVYNDGQCMPTIRDFVIYGSFFAFYVPLTVMVVTYALTIKILCDNQKLMKNVVRKQRECHRLKKEQTNVLLTPNSSYNRISANHSAEISMSYCASYNESIAQEIIKEERQKDSVQSLNMPKSKITKPEIKEDNTDPKARDAKLDTILQTYLSVSQPELFISNGKMISTATSQPRLDKRNGLLTPGPAIYICRRQSNSLKLPSSTSHPHLSPIRKQSNDVCNQRSLAETRDRSQTTSQPHLAKHAEANHLMPVTYPIGSAHSQPHLPSMKRSRMLSSGASNHSIKSLNSHKSVTSVFELESVKNFDCVSAASSLNSMISKGSNGLWEDFEEPKMLQRLSQIESEMDECLFEKELENDEDVFEEQTDNKSHKETESEESEDLCTTKLIKETPILINRCPQEDTLKEMPIPPVMISSPPVSSRNSMDSFGEHSDKLHTINLKMKENAATWSGQCTLSPNPSKRSSYVSLHRARSSLSIANEDSSKSDDEKEKDELSTDELLFETMSQTTQSTASTFHRFSPRMSTRVNIQPPGYASAWKTFLKRKKDQASFKVNGYCHTVISKRMATNEKKASKVLGIIFAVFVTLWTPFFIVNVISVVCESCMASISQPVMTGIVWLGYMSSLANPIIYTMFNTSFRKAFYRILTCKQRQRRRPTVKSHTNGSNWNNSRQPSGTTGTLNVA